MEWCILFSMRYCKDILGCNLLRGNRGLTKTLIFDATVYMHHLWEYSAGDNVMTYFPRGWGVAFHADCLLRRGMAWSDPSCFL